MDQAQRLLNESIEDTALMAQVFDAAVTYIDATEYAHHCPARGLVKERLKDLSDAVHEYQEKDL
jgi:hypothetical protein